MGPISLWVSDLGKLVCIRPSCCGDELAQRVLADDGEVDTYEIEGERFSRMSPTDLAELAPLIAGTDGQLTCDGLHIRYDMRAQELRIIEEVTQ